MGDPRAPGGVLGWSSGGPGLDRASLRLEGCFWSSAQSRVGRGGLVSMGRGPRWGRGLRSCLKCRGGPEADLPVSASLCPHGTQVTTCSVLCHMPASGRVTLVSVKTKQSGQECIWAPQRVQGSGSVPRPPPPAQPFCCFFGG